MNKIKLQKINKFLFPKNIVLVGGKEVEIIIGQLKKLNFNGKIWPVNPKRKKIGNIKCYENILNIPGTPDASFLAIPAKYIEKAVKDLQERKNSGIVCYSAGFSESGKNGEKLEKELKKSLKDQVLLGPNCYGYINYLSKSALWPFPIPDIKAKKGIALITQSGMLSSDILMTNRSLPIVHMVSIGNQLNIKIEDLIEYFCSRNEVKVIGLHIEGIKNINLFGKACIKALRKKKPIVVFKTGNSQIGKKLTMSHTGSLSGDENLYNAFFEKLGIIKINDIETFLETLKFLSVTKIKSHDHIVAFTCSGGGATMIADYAEKKNLNFPTFKRRSKSRSKRKL